MANTDITTILACMLEDLPQVSVGRHIHNANFLVGEKVFAFIKDGGVAMKLPRARIQELMETRNAAPLVMGRRVMKEWVVIKHEDPEEYKKDLDLFNESIAFVSSKA